ILHNELKQSLSKKSHDNSKKQLLSKINDEINNNVDIFWEEEMVSDEEFDNTIEEIDIDTDN
ncbi:12306_t:CDS:1, partial [Racocetra fulgida]